MLTYNKHCLLGRLGQDPELRYTQSNIAVVTLSLATNEPVKKPDGSWDTRTEWHRVIVWGAPAERVADQCFKGDPIFIEGSPYTKEWEDKNGNKRYTTEIKANFVSILKPSDEAEYRASSTQQQPARREPPKPPTLTRSPEPSFSEDDDDLPF